MIKQISKMAIASVFLLSLFQLSGCSTVPEKNAAVISNESENPVAEKQEVKKGSPWGILSALAGFALGLAIF